MARVRWIGVDWTGGTLRAARSDGTEVADAALRAARAGGRCVEAALPAECLFAELVDLPPAARRNPEAYLPGLLDVKLPDPVEDCLVVHGRAAGASALALAIRRDEYARRLDEFAARAGFRPERVAPAPLALWRRVAADLRARRAAEAGAALHLHASGDVWTLLAGFVAPKAGACRLQGVATAAAGDLGAVRRDCKILLSRIDARPVSMTVSGDAADASLAESLGEVAPGLRATLSPSPRLYLAAALAADGEQAGDAPFGNFALGEFEHPARASRVFRKMAAALAALLGASALFLVAAASFKARAASALRAADSLLAASAARLSGGPSRGRGPGAVAAARNEFGERVNRAVEGFARPSPLGALREVFAFAETRGMKIAAFEAVGGRLAVSGRAEAEGDAAALAKALESRGYAVTATAPEGGTPGFSLSISCGGDAL